MKQYQAEIALLKQHYQKTLDAVKGNDFAETYAKQKMLHSLQVIGAGNYIMKHEPVFQNRSAEFIRCAVLAYLFHDIGRFDEIKQTQKLDHGIRGAEILSQIPEYNDPRIIIPVRHHGHMIEDFYEDEQYQSIRDESLKKEIEQIIFLARDADKIANFYLLKTQFDKYRHLWVLEENEKHLYGKINPKVAEYFATHQVMKHKDQYSFADLFLGIISWIFDLNYQISFDFTHKHQIVDALCTIIARFNSQKELQERLANCAKEYIESVYLNHP